MQNKTTNKTVPLILGFIFFVIGGWSIVFLFPELQRKHPFFIPILIVVTIVYIWLFIKWVTNPKKFVEQQEAAEQKMQENVFGKAVSTAINAWTVDIQVFKIIFKRFQLAVPFLLSIVAIFLVIFIPLASGFDGQLLKQFYQARISPNLFFPIMIFIYSFICCSIFVLGYISLGYFMRKKYLKTVESPSVIFMRFFKLFGFVLILSFVWIILVFTFGGGKKNTLSQIGNQIFRGVLSIFKIFIYTNIVRVSMGDEKSSFKDTYEFVKKDAYQMLRIWFGSGLLVSIVFILCLMALAILGKTGIILATENIKNIVAPAFFIGLIFVFTFRAFAEQIGVFSIYLKDKYNVDILN